MNYIEQLLAKLEDQEARTQFSELATKHAVLNDWIFDPEIKAKTEQISEWAESEWDYEHGMSKLEFRQQQQLSELQSQLTSAEAAGNKTGMELNDLNEYLGKYIKDNGLMTKTELDAQVKLKEDDFNKQLGIVSTLATRIPYLNAKYMRELDPNGFDPDAFVKEAQEKGYTQYGTQGLDKYYEEFTKDKLAAKQAADLETKLAAAREEGKRLGEEERRAANNTGSGAGPDVGGSPEMGHFEAKLRLGANGFDSKAEKVPAELGLGQTAKYAAEIMDRKDRETRVQ